MDEYDSRDRPFIWSLTGGEQRFNSGLADRYVADDVAQVQQTVTALLHAGLPAQQRSRQADFYLARLAELDTTAQIDPATVRDLYQGERS